MKVTQEMLKRIGIEMVVLQALVVVGTFRCALQYVYLDVDLAKLLHPFNNRSSDRDGRLDAVKILDPMLTAMARPLALFFVDTGLAEEYKSLAVKQG